MANPTRLTTPAVQLLGSLCAIALLLGAVLLGAVVLDGRVEDAAAGALERARRAWITLAIAVPDASVDPSAVIEIVDPVLFPGNPVMQYTARGPAAGRVAMKLTAPDGYNGPIELAIGIDSDGRIMNVTVLAHEETPGFGADILAPAAPWLAEFAGRSLERPPADAWRLSRAGGAIDGVSGATITADAMVTAINRGLRLFERRTSRQE